MKKNILRTILIILILCWMYIVFGFSGASGDTSTGISEKIAKLFSGLTDDLYLVEQVIRKLAHLFEYILRWNANLRIVFNI